MLGFTEQTLGLQGFVPCTLCFGKAREPSEGKRHMTHWLHISLHHLGVRITMRALCGILQALRTSESPHSLRSLRGVTHTEPGVVKRAS